MIAKVNVEKQKQSNHQVSDRLNHDRIQAAKRKNVIAGIVLLVINLIAGAVVIMNLIKFQQSAAAEIGQAQRMQTGDAMYLANVHTALLVALAINVILAVVLKPQWQAPKTSLLLFFQKDLWIFLGTGSLIGLHYATKAIVRFTQDPYVSSSWLNNLATAPTIGQLIADLFVILLGIVYLIGALVSAGALSSNYEYYSMLQRQQHERDIEQLARAINNSF